MADKVKLKTLLDDEEIEVDKEIAYKSILIKEYFDQGGDDAEACDLPPLKKDILEKVMVYCEYIHQNPDKEPKLEKPLKSDKIDDLVDEWFVGYLNAEKDVLFELIKASNYLDINSLLELSSAKVATMIKGRPIQEIRDFFNIVNDFTPEEEEWVKQESAWAEECF